MVGVLRLSIWPFLVALGMVSAAHAASRKDNSTATVCIRSLEIVGLEAQYGAALASAIELVLAKHEVRVGRPNDDGPGAKKWCRLPTRGNQGKRSVVLLDARALRVGPLIQMSVAFSYPGGIEPVLARDWSVDAAANPASGALAEALAEGARLAHQLVGTRPRGARGLPPALQASVEKAASGAVGDAPATEGEENVVATAEPAVDETHVEAAAETTSLMRRSSYWLMGSGGVGLAVGAGFGVDALLRQQRAREVDTPGAQLEIPRMRQSQRIANWCFLGGGVVAVSGAVLWWLSDSPPQAAVAVEATRGGHLLVVGGRF